MEYIVAENDTLSAIASKYNVSAERILRLNNLRSAEDLRHNKIRRGRILCPSATAAKRQSN